MKAGLEHRAVGHGRQIEHPGAPGPWPGVPLRRAAHRVSPGIGGVVERARVDHRPVEEISARVVRMAVDIENVDDTQLAHRDDQSVGGLLRGELVGARVRLASHCAQIDGLSEKRTLQTKVRRLASDLVRLAAREAGEPEGIVQPETLVNLRIEPELRAAPEARAQVERRIRGLSANRRRQTVRSGVWSVKPVRLLLGVGCLPVERESRFRCRGGRLDAACGASRRTSCRRGRLRLCMRRLGRAAQQCHRGERRHTPGVATHVTRESRCAMEEQHAAALIERGRRSAARSPCLAA